MNGQIERLLAQVELLEEDQELVRTMLDTKAQTALRVRNEVTELFRPMVREFVAADEGDEGFEALAENLRVLDGVKQRAFEVSHALASASSQFSFLDRR